MLKRVGCEREHSIGFNSGSLKIYVESISEKDVLLKFKSGETLTFEDAAHNMLVLGTTGSGKTTSIILPAVNSLIEAGFGGLIIDIKGNMTDYVRAIAKIHGRQGDIVEIGTGEGAEKINLLSGLTEDEMKTLLEKLLVLTTASEDDHNKQFHASGLRCLCETIEFLETSAKKMNIKLTLALLDRLLNNYQYAQMLYSKYKDHFFDENDDDEAELATRIGCDQFHILQSDIKKQDQTTWNEQVAFRYGVIKNGIRKVREATGIENNFFAQNDHNLDIEKLVFDENKIIVLRVSGASGDIGVSIARHIVELYYQAVFNRGLFLPEDRFTFFIADEAQEIVNVNSKLAIYNDHFFTARSREHRNITIMGTQSVAALQAKAGDTQAVLSMIANFNVLVNFYNVDPQTCELTDSHNLESLASLKSGEAFLIKYDVETRQHQYGKVCVQDLHDNFQEAVKPYLQSTLPLSSPISKEVKKAQMKQQREIENQYIKPIPEFIEPLAQDSERSTVLCPNCAHEWEIETPAKNPDIFQFLESKKKDNTLKVKCPNCECRFDVKFNKFKDIIKAFSEPEFKNVEWTLRRPKKAGLYLWRVTAGADGGLLIINKRGQHSYPSMEQYSGIEYAGPFEIDGNMIVKKESKKRNFDPDPTIDLIDPFDEDSDF